MGDGRPDIPEGSFPWQVAQNFNQTVDEGLAKQAVAGLDLSAFKSSVQYSGDNTQVAARPVGDMSQDQTRTV